MSKYQIGDHVEVIKEGYAIERGRQGKVIGETQDQTFRYCIIKAGGVIEAVPDIYLSPYIPGDNPKLIELLDNISFSQEDTEENRNYFRVFKYITNEGPVSFEIIAAVMYEYGKTQGVKKERQRVKAKKKTAYSEK